MIRIFFLAGYFLIAVAASVGSAQEAVLGIAVEAVEGDEVVEGEREVVEAELLIDADEAVEVDVVEAAGGVVGGFFQMIAGGFGAGDKPRTVSRAALNKNVDEIKSDAELRKLERELGQHPNMQGIMPQLKTQLNVARDIELRLLHLACHLKRSEFKAIQKEGKTATLRVQLKVCQEQISAMQGSRRGKQTSSDITTLIEQRMLAIARRKLGRARSAAYQSEIEARRGFRREALIHSMASSLDSQLMFSAQQREEIMQAFRTGWSENWFRCVQYLANNGLHYFPDIPKQAIRGLLNQGQQKIFQSMPWQPQNLRMSFFNGNVFGFGQNGLQRLDNELEFAPEDEEAGE